MVKLVFTEDVQSHVTLSNASDADVVAAISAAAAAVASRK
jgi:hypothetical protein